MRLTVDQPLRPGVSGRMLVALLLGAALVAPQLPARSASASRNGNGQPRAEVENPDYDWGQVLKGEIVRHTYRVHNVGDGPLRITKVRPTCGCTTESFTRGHIAPGETATVELEIDTRRLPRGRVHKKATIFTTDPERSEITVSFGGELLTVLRTEPAEPTFEGLASEGVTGTIDLLPGTDLGFQLVQAVPRLRVASLEQTEVLEEGRHYRLHLRAGPALPGTRREEIHVTVRTPDGEEHLEVVPVVIEHLDRIILEPTQTVMFNVHDTEPLLEPGATPPVQELVLRSARPDIRFSITEVTITGQHKDSFRVSHRTDQEGQRYTVAVEALEYLDTRFARAQLRIVTDDPDAPLKEVRIFAQFDPRKLNSSRKGKQ